MADATPQGAGSDTEKKSEKKEYIDEAESKYSEARAIDKFRID